MQRICVYCGSNSGVHDFYTAAAKDLAGVLVQNDLELVFGGSAVGTMAVLADAVLDLGGKVHGVIPKFLEEREIAHTGLTELHIVPSMHARKSLMADLSDGFIALPGGFGTLEELIEIVTWGQLKFHDKPCGVLNVHGYFDKLLAYLDHAQTEGFLRQENRAMLLSDNDALGLIRQFERYSAPHIDKWINLEQQS
jgi:uncharacterized protein (TIGR00730 family)